jgi:hypothetical protein
METQIIENIWKYPNQLKTVKSNAGSCEGELSVSL